jgi:hypothetical protein
MADDAGEGPIARLEALVGEWRIAADFEGSPPAEDERARVVFEWMPGRRFLIERWELPLPDPAVAPATGIAVIGADPGREGGFLQHYFDSRGVARVYKMSFEDGVWKLWRDSADFSPLDFSQRYTGTFSDDGKTIAGRWEISHDHETWEHDFDLTYSRPEMSDLADLARCFHWVSSPEAKHSLNLAAQPRSRSRSSIRPSRSGARRRRT